MNIERSLILFIFICTVFPGMSRATILEFDQIRDATGTVISTVSGNAPEDDYGDRVTGTIVHVPGGQYAYGDGGEGYTPNVSVAFYSGSATASNPGVSLWRDKYGDLTNVLIGNNNSQSLIVSLTADAGFSVELFHFDLAGWPMADYTINGVSVSDGVSTLFSQSNVLVQGTMGHTAIDFVTPLSADDLLIKIDFSNLPGSKHDNIGLDNIRFGQNPPVFGQNPSVAVSEPSIFVLFSLGILGLFGITKRQAVNVDMCSKALNYPAQTT